jgi:hypothetical protein
MKHWGETNANTFGGEQQRSVLTKQNRPVHGQSQRLFTTSFHKGVFSDTFAEMTLLVDGDGKSLAGSPNKHQLRYEPPTRKSDGRMTWQGKLVARIERIEKSRRKEDCRIQVTAGMDPILVVVLIVASFDSGSSGGAAHMGASGAAAAAASNAAAGGGASGGGGGGC